MKRVFFIWMMLAVFMAGCIGGGPSPIEVTYVTPCNVMGTGILVRTNGTVLNTDIVEKPLSLYFVDDISSDKAASYKKSYSVSCGWGSNVGEIKSHYYCNGSYIAPEVNEQGLIVRRLKKNFKIGFSVEEFKGDSWVDMSGRLHREESYFDLTVSSVEAKCLVVA
jgi:hypothetical protein